METLWCTIHAFEAAQPLNVPLLRSLIPHHPPMGSEPVGCTYHHGQWAQLLHCLFLENTIVDITVITAASLCFSMLFTMVHKCRVASVDDLWRCEPAAAAISTWGGRKMPIFSR